jgi:hypothetical protein
MNYFILAKIGNVNMKKTFQKTLIAVAAGAALMSVVGPASANSLLFPYFKVGAAVQSVISLSNTSTVTEAIHYSYGVGSTCAHYDNWGKLTANDMISHSLAVPVNGGAGVLPANDTSVPGYLSQNNTEGFVIVSNTGSASTTALRGSLAVIEAATSGVFVSFPGIDNALSTLSLNNTIANAGDTTFGRYNVATNGNLNEGKFDQATLILAGTGGIGWNRFALTWLPTDLVQTTWWALPIGDMSAFTRGARQTWEGTFALGNTSNNVWDNEENYVSGRKDIAAGCLQAFGVANLLTDGQQAAFAVDPVLSKGGKSGMYKGTGSVSGAVRTQAQFDAYIQNWALYNPAGTAPNAALLTSTAAVPTWVVGDGIPGRVADNVILMKLQTVLAPAAPFNRGTLLHRELGTTGN